MDTQDSGQLFIFEKLGNQLLVIRLEKKVDHLDKLGQNYIETVLVCESIMRFHKVHFARGLAQLLILAWIFCIGAIGKRIIILHLHDPLVFQKKALDDCE